MNPCSSPYTALIISSILVRMTLNPKSSLSKKRPRWELQYDRLLQQHDKQRQEQVCRDYVGFIVQALRFRVDDTTVGVGFIEIVHGSCVDGLSSAGQRG